MGFESSSESESSCCANSASFIVDFSSLFSIFCRIWGFCGGGPCATLLFKLNDLRGGIGGASSKVFLAIMLEYAMALLLFDICSTSINEGTLQLEGAAAVAVSEDVLDDEELIEDDEDITEGVECVALTTIVFGAFPFITFTLTKFTTVVLLFNGDDDDDDDDGRKGGGCCLETIGTVESKRISFCCTDVVLLVWFDELVVDVVGMTFFVNLGEV